MRIRDIMAKAGEIQGLDSLNILSFALSLRKEEVLMDLDREIGEEEAWNVLRLFEERKAGKPLAYITGEKEFFSHSFAVDRGVLIPRPETELLVEEALTILERRSDLVTVVDMGTGSGAIGATIARLSSRKVMCVDVSMEALRTARRNGLNSGVPERLTFVCSDLFEAIGPGRRFDMILANLPYVAEDEWDEVMIDVKGYEPALALLGGLDGLDVYRRFVSCLPDRLNRNGFALMEIGAPGQAGKMVDLLKSCGLSATIKKDLAHKERVITGSWTNS